MRRVPVYEGNEPYLFVSYAHKDSATVLPVIEHLFEKKFRIWYDEGIAPGSEWPHNIAYHLENADTVLLFVSGNSLASLNCENEVVRAIELKKKLIAYNLSGSTHPLLNDAVSLSDTGELVSSLDLGLIGDGISGYEHVNRKAKRSVLWDIILICTAVLLCGVGLAMYGLNQGWFDAYLPGRIQVEIVDTLPQEERADTISSDILAQAILSKLDRDDLMEEIPFETEEDHNRFCDVMGYGKDRPITYFDLTNDHRDEVFLEYADQQVFDLLKYYPALKTVKIVEGTIDSFEPFDQCPYLQTLMLGYSVFPIDIPDDIRYEIEVFR